MSDARDIVERLMAWRTRYGVDIAGPETPDMCEEAAVEIARFRGALNVVGACLADMKTGLEKHLKLLPVAVKEVGRE